MFIPSELKQRIDELSQRVGCKLTIVRCWQGDFDRPVMYCNVRGVLNESPDLLIEIAGTVCAELNPDRDDETNLFMFVNGDRVGLHDESFKYLIGYGNAPFAWDYNDEGFDQFLTLDESTFSQPIDQSLVIAPPDAEQNADGE
ncbi:MAG: hypothetical protein CME33_09365 [Gimesia sp.]|uniref:hypothetical protein n=1 Tax=Gimesia sp. TaxID=2024833 RepID=UPI000C3DAB47|nr:hypothetical protein [Gimesia sp.]MAX36758.1 hypothetical protein [Gimesia sp.]|tara:strand:+ start:10414 stop:10842 length:429 start_codon:yes stop_codon:yes gene_type:complete